MAAVLPEFSKWSSAQQFVTQLPAWVPADHQQRIAAYSVYQEIYWSHVSATYKVMNRGLDAEDSPVYVPSSRIMVDTLNRYIGPKLVATVDPLTGSEATQQKAVEAFKALFARERFASRYAANKRDGIIKGDWLWHIVGDPLKPEGSRLSILSAKPDSYFPIYEDETIEGGDPSKLVMVKLAEQVIVGKDERVRVQTYERVAGGDSYTVLSSLILWKPDEWFKWRYDDEEKAPVDVLSPPTPLPAGITTIPVYHVPNRPESGEVFGTSPMRGLEVLQAALNQSVTDEDLAVALMGLGVYATDEAGSPIDPVTGEARSWMVYPGAVIENSKGLRKVEGLTGLQAYTEHIGRLEKYVGDSSGATEAAKGNIDVATAESGIALMLRLAPTLALAEEQDQIILDVHAQMFYDIIQQWFPAVEGLNFTDVSMIPTLGDKLPINRTAEVAMVGQLVVSGVLSAGSARGYLQKRGFADMFDMREGELVLAEKVANAAAEQGDAALDNRADQETTPNTALGGLPDE